MPSQPSRNTGRLPVEDARLPRFDPAKETERILRCSVGHQRNPDQHRRSLWHGQAPDFVGGDGTEVGGGRRVGRILGATVGRMFDLGLQFDQLGRFLKQLGLRVKPDAALLETSLPGQVGAFVTIDRLEVCLEALGVKGLEHMLTLEGIRGYQTESKTTRVAQPANELQYLVVTDRPRLARSQGQDKVVT